MDEEENENLITLSNGMTIDLYTAFRDLRFFAVGLFGISTFFLIWSCLSYFVLEPAFAIFGVLCFTSAIVISICMSIESAAFSGCCAKVNVVSISLLCSGYFCLFGIRVYFDEKNYSMNWVYSSIFFCFLWQTFAMLGYSYLSRVQHLTEIRLTNKGYTLINYRVVSIIDDDSNLEESISGNTEDEQLLPSPLPPPSAPEEDSEDGLCTDYMDIPPLPSATVVVMGELVEENGVGNQHITSASSSSETENFPSEKQAAATSAVENRVRMSLDTFSKYIKSYIKSEEEIDQSSSDGNQDCTHSERKVPTGTIAKLPVAIQKEVSDDTCIDAQHHKRAVEENVSCSRKDDNLYKNDDTSTEIDNNKNLPEHNVLKSDEKSTLLDKNLDKPTFEEKDSSKDKNNAKSCSTKIKKKSSVNEECNSDSDSITNEQDDLEVLQAWNEVDDLERPDNVDATISVGPEYRSFITDDKDDLEILQALNEVDEVESSSFHRDLEYVEGDMYDCYALQSIDEYDAIDESKKVLQSLNDTEAIP